MGELKPNDRTRLERAHEAGLFVELDDARIESLFQTGEVSITADDVLAELVETYLCEEPRELHLRAPPSVQELIEILPSLAPVVRGDPDRKHIHLVHDEEDAEDEPVGTLFAPESHHAWVGVFNAALKIAGDERSFVALVVRDHEEPIYLLVNPAQRDALAEIELLAADHDEVALPERVRPDARAKQLGEALARKGVSARGADERVELTLDLASATALLERLRTDQAHDARISERVNRALERIP